jgi:alkanesulfonate monooxygenase SsuD/methylene tetrahydromethanopterin reductase-like flavin-dependent oxidoreductase (luciferase family)
MSAVFAHHMSPEIAIQALREYRREFTPRHEGDQPYSAMSVLAYASDDAPDVTEFEAGWTLTIQNIRRGVREPLRPEAVREFAASEQFRSGASAPDGRMVTGPADAVARRLRELRTEAEVDEIVVVTPSIDRGRRQASYRAIAEAWGAQGL